MLPHEAIFSKLRQDDVQPGNLDPDDFFMKPESSPVSYNRKVEGMGLLCSVGRREIEDAHRTAGGRPLGKVELQYAE